MGYAKLESCKSRVDVATQCFLFSFVCLFVFPLCCIHLLFLVK